MKKLFAFVLLVAFFALGANAQLLYKISGKGLEKPSYIVGTYHLANVKFVDSIPGIRQAMADVEQVYGEVATSEMHAPDNLMKMQQAMFLPDGKTLSDVLTKEEMGKINFFINNVNDVEKLPNGFKASIEDVKISIFPIFYIEVVEGSYKQRQEITEEEYNSIKNIFLDKIVADENKIYNGIKKALEESVAKKNQKQK